MMSLMTNLSYQSALMDACAIWYISSLDIPNPAQEVAALQPRYLNKTIILQLCSRVWP
jgi:hypothetical protein